MSEFFRYEIHGSPYSSLLYYEVGYFDKRGDWWPCVISGPLYAAPEEATAAAEKAARAIAVVYKRRFGISSSNKRWA